MKTVFLALLATSVIAGPALAQGRAGDPTGEWRVADGKARIRVVDCGQALWGVVSWEAKTGRDTHNPQPALRTRPTLGMPILLHMQPTDQPDHWEGQIYNADDGNTYDGSITLANADTLRVEGCALGFLCGSDTWRRAPQSPRVAGHERGTTGAGTPATAPAAAICSAVARGARGAH
ncbi:MAG TPA: DUF2147 domain-containing protein [Pseudolabrys sp.]|nr:DUF2147 domain-containing protein [Pseudolabrys sp.]